MNTRSRATAWLLTTFAVGLAAGIAIGVLWLQDTPPDRGNSKDSPFHHNPSEVVERIDAGANLQLDAEQKTKLEAIIAEGHRRFREAAETSKSRFEQLRTEGRDKIRSILTADQAARFDEFIKREESKHKRQDSKK